MVGARTEAGPTVEEAGTRTRAVRVGAAGRIARAEAVGDNSARGGRAVEGACSVGAVAGAAVDLAEGDRRVRHRRRGRVAGGLVTATADMREMAAGTAVLLGRQADIRPGLKAVELTGALAMVTAEATEVVTMATVGPAMRTAVTLPPVDPVMATAEIQAATTELMPAGEVAKATGTRTEIRAMVAAVMECLRIAAMLETLG
jgi:hypothetical protein